MICSQRDDITLLIRNFNFQLSIPMSPSGTLRSYSMSFNANSESSVKFDSQLYTLSSNINETLTEASITSSDSSEQLKSTQSQNVQLDEEGRIGAYVDFSSFYQAVQKAKDEGKIPKDAKY